MKTFLLTLLLAVYSATVWAECGNGGLVVLVNRSNPSESLSMAQLRKLMLGDVRNWPDKKPVLVVRRDAASPAFQCVLSQVVRMTDSEYKRYLLNVEFRGDDAVALKTASTPALATKMVGDAQGGITVVESSAAPPPGGALKILKINGKLPGEPGYPL